MSDNAIQTSFNAGEWAPALNARVDLEKYHSGAALLRNFFVDYRGGATTRPGTRYIATSRSTGAARLIPFQASFLVSYVLEFGVVGSAGYLTFYNNGAPILESTTAISAITQANPGVITDTAHGYSTGDVIFISNVVGMTQLNGNYYVISGTTANTYTIKDLFGNNVSTLAFGAYISGGTAQRVYTIASPYKSSELAQIKFAQNVNQLILCHPNYVPYILTLNSVTNWTLAPITFGSTIATPAAPTVTSTLAAGGVTYAYVATAVDANGQESAPSPFGSLTSRTDLRTTPGTNVITLTSVTGAVSYNVYKAEPSYNGAIPAGSQFGFAGNTTGLVFNDSNIAQDFSQGPPVALNPFFGSGVATVTITAPGSYPSAVPAISFSGGGGSGAAAQCTLSVTSSILAAGGNGYVVGDLVVLNYGIVMQVTGVGAFPSAITSYILTGAGQINAPAGFAIIANPLSQIATSGHGSGASFDVAWGLASISMTSPGTGYATPPAVAISLGGVGAATSVLGAASSGNPTVPGFTQQRLIMAGPVQSPSQMNFSQPGSPFNFNTTFPVQPDNAIQGTLTNTSLNTIKALVTVSTGLIVLSDKSAWLVNGGSPGSPISALSFVANSQGYSGCADLPPIATPTDILYVQSKGSIVRDLAFNFYLNTYVGADISILSSHLFYGFSLKEWVWAEEPFKTVWAVRNDGQLLSLCFVKDQQMIAWAHSDTLGTFQSICTIPEATPIGTVDAVYHIVQRTVQGQSVQYIERFVELSYPNNYKSSWQVDAGVGYNGTPATSFSGAQHLGGQVVTGVADGIVINFTMPISGTFVFGPGGTTGLTAIPNASIVTVGLAFLPQIQTLALDLGQPTVQGKRKKVSAVTIRAKDALGLSAGRSFASALPMKDLALGNVGTMSNALVVGLQTTDARIIVDPQWDVFGQYCIQQPNPYPASVLGVIPEIEVGDSQK